MSDFMDQIERMFHDPNEPTISDDRVLHQTSINIYTVMFKRCNHFMNIPWHVIHSMLSSHEVVKYINDLKCKMCEEQFREMEIKLNKEVEQFIKYGGKL